MHWFYEQATHYLQKDMVKLKETKLGKRHLQSENFAKKFKNLDDTHDRQWEEEIEWMIISFSFILNSPLLPWEQNSDDDDGGEVDKCVFEGACTNVVVYEYWWTLYCW